MEDPEAVVLKKIPHDTTEIGPKDAVNSPLKLYNELLWESVLLKMILPTL